MYICLAIDIDFGVLIHLRPCQHDNGHIDGRSQIKVHTDGFTALGLP